MGLLDFGAGREFDTKFLAEYIEIIHGSYTSDRDKILKHSHDLGFLTGEENKEMLNAHTQSCMAVGEPFRSETGLYNFE